jgi:hypothetical protein
LELAYLVAESVKAGRWPQNGGKVAAAG